MDELFENRNKTYGALPEARLDDRLQKLIKKGTVYSLGLPLYEGIPVPGPMVSFTITPRMRHGDLEDIRPASAAAETVVIPGHVSTHIDALCHIGEHQDATGKPDERGEVQLYAGKDRTAPARKLVNYRGQLRFSASEMVPVVTRGILLDVAGWKGLQILPDSYEVTRQDILDTLKWEGIEVTPGTAVFIRTGFYHHLRSENHAYKDAIAGLGLAGAKWLVEKGMILAGADNMTVEALPPMDHRVHRFLIVHNGITLVENLFLEELAADKVYEFLVILSPLRVHGATASWVNPLAIA